MSHGLNRLTVYYDGDARRKGDRVWKVVVPVSAHVVEHVRLPDVPEPMLIDAGTTAKVDAALPAATAVVKKRLGIEPTWLALPSGMVAVHHLASKEAA